MTIIINDNWDFFSENDFNGPNKSYHTAVWQSVKHKDRMLTEKESRAAKLVIVTQGLFDNYGADLSG